MRKNKAAKIKSYLKMAMADRDYLKWCAKLSDSQRLKWLEEANRFINEFLASEKRKRWEEFIKQQ